MTRAPATLRLTEPDEQNEQLASEGEGLLINIEAVALKQIDEIRRLHAELRVVGHAAVLDTIGVGPVDADDNLLSSEAVEEAHMRVGLFPAIPQVLDPEDIGFGEHAVHLPLGPLVRAEQLVPVVLTILITHHETPFSMKIYLHYDD